MLTIIILFIVILSVLVFVHELGHFVTARRNGIRVDEFGFGFPPRVGGIVKDKKTGKWKFVWGGKIERMEDTIYSINWIPLGGFVKIKGEDGSEKDDPDSFATKSAWIRIKVLVAGVMMNFVLAWAILAVVFMIGAPKAVNVDEGADSDTAVQIGRVVPDSPAEQMGILPGDELVGLLNEQGNFEQIESIGQVQQYTQENKGDTITLQVVRGDETITLNGSPRMEYPQNEGALGVELVRTAIVKYPWYQAIWEGLVATVNMIVLILVAFGTLIKSLFVSTGTPLDVAGPVGIAYLTKQVADLGLVYILQFTAILSVNLGIINILPIPALDGGRVLFVLIEVIKGSPVSKVFEQKVHTIGFIALLLLMLVITLYDFSQFDLLEKIKNAFL